MAVYTQADIDALRSALALGALKVRRGDEEVTYRSQEDMRRQLAIMEADVAGSSRGPRIRRLTPRTLRGV
jgi:hypothetical protein